MIAIINLLKNETFETSFFNKFIVAIIFVENDNVFINIWHWKILTLSLYADGKKYQHIMHC
jgi:hypothetical protein